AKVVVNDVKEDLESEAMRGVDEMFEVFWAPVRGKRSKPRHTVVTPAMAPRKSRERHELDRGDAELPKLLEMSLRGSVGALFREGPYVNLIDDARSRRRRGVASVGIVRLDHLCRSVHSKGQKMGEGIGASLTVDNELIQRPGGDARPLELERVIGDQAERSPLSFDVGR